MTGDRWEQSGLAFLTGDPDGPPDHSRAPLLDRAQANLDRFRTLTGVRTSHPDAAEFLSGRAALTGFRRGGRISAGGATRLIAARDTWCALSLPRPDDVDLVPALLQCPLESTDVWPHVEAVVAESDAAEFVARARLLGLAAAVLGEVSPAPTPIRSRGTTRAHRPMGDLLVADLSSLWAGPLCGRLLADAGATVVKVEGAMRPDGTRRGNPEFFTWMNGPKLAYAADFSGDPAAVARLLRAADVVIEASRPRALARHGLDADHLAPRAGQVWLRITGHGAEGEAAQWVGFGDDAAVAGGLVGRSPRGPVFCADAIADPLTGIESARLVTEALDQGGGVLIDVALSAVAARHAALGTSEHHVGAIARDRAPLRQVPQTQDPQPLDPETQRRPGLHETRPSVPLVGGHPIRAVGADNPVVDALVDERLTSPRDG
ncbi:CoA transferase [Gordonia sp. NPDC003376]